MRQENLQYGTIVCTDHFTFDDTVGTSDFKIEVSKVFILGLSLAPVLDTFRTGPRVFTLSFLQRITPQI